MLIHIDIYIIYFDANDFFHNSNLIDRLVQVIKQAAVLREHSQTELVSGSTGLSMKNILYFSFAASSKL